MAARRWYHVDTGQFGWITIEADDRQDARVRARRMFGRYGFRKVYRER